MLVIALLLMVATFALFAVGFYRTSSKYVIEKRLTQIREGEVQTTEEELSQPFFQRVILPIGDAIAKAVRKNTPQQASDRIQKQLIMAGVFPHMTPTQLYGLSLLTSVSGVALLFFILLMVGKGAGGVSVWTDPLNFAFLIVGAASGYKVPHFILGRMIRNRQQEILLTLPYAIDLISISVEAGMGFDAGVSYTMRKIKGPLADEFNKTLNEIRLGKPRLEALDDLGNRTGVEELKTFITAIVHAIRLGGNITNTLRIQADSIRVRRRQRAQEQAMKAPVKMVLPLVFFIFPALFVVLLGPAFIKILELIRE